MAEDILMFSKCLKLFISIILIFNQITNSFGLDYPGGIYCPPLTSNPSTHFECKFDAKPTRDCQNPENGTTVLISCNPSYQEPSLEINPIRLCQNGKWSSTIPQCYQSNRGVLSEVYDPSQNDQFTYQRIYCPPLISSSSTNFKCKFDAKPTRDCQNPENGTTVLISCNPSYEEPSLEINPIRLCQNGKWSSTIPQCYPSNSEVFFADYDPSLSDQTTYQRSCPSLTSSISTKLTCIYKGQLINNCENATTGTLLVISCNPSYEEPSLVNNPIRMCKDGNWSSFIPQCQSSRVLSSCPSLTSSLSTKLKCIYNGQLLNNCENATTGTLLVISCNPSYEESSLVNNPIRMCKDGNWSSSIPQCHSSRVLSSCPSLTSSLSTNLKCIYNGQLLNNCENATTGTLLAISCNPSYEEPSLVNNPIRTCNDGKWSSSIPQCHSICGKVPSQNIGKFNLSFGSKISLTEQHNYPWHVGIYKNYGKEYACGGSIIHSKIILTAAHCVTDDVGNHKPIENLLVVAGNYYRNYEDVRSEYSQYSKVAQISTPIGYKGYMLYQASDIAILILDEPFAFSIAVQPVCLALNKESENLKFLLNSIGITTGWGSIKRNGPLSDQLKQLIIPYIPFRKFFQEIPETFRQYITSDKICGGTNICTGDGGGGFIFKNVVEDRYYIKAILSIGLFNDLGKCYLNQYSAYTSILHNIEFVKDAIESAL